MKRMILAAVVAGLALGGLSSAQPSESESQADWTEHGFDLKNHAYNFLETEIRASTVHRLKTKWSFPVNEMVPTTPAVVDGIVYFGADDGSGNGS